MTEPTQPMKIVKPAPPMGSETRMAQKIGAVVARQMLKANPKAQVIPPHRWAQKIARLGQRLLFVGFAAVAWKLAWPWYVVAVTGVLALRALAPELTDSLLRWLFRVGKEAKALKDGSA